MYKQPRDHYQKIIRIGDRVRILCSDDIELYSQIGVVILIDKREHRRRSNIFVRMSGGGDMWWDGENVKLQSRSKT